MQILTNNKWIFFIVGLLGGFVYPPFDVYYPILSVIFLSIYLSYMLVQIDTSRSARQAFNRMFWLSEISYIISFNWLMKPFFFIPENIILLLLLAPLSLFIFSAFLGLFVEFSALIAYKVSENKRYFAFALSIAFFEWVRSWIFTGFPWNQFSLVWSNIPSVLQSLSLIGPFGLTFITIYVLGFPYLLFYKKQFKNIYGISIIIISILTLLFGWWRISTYKNLESTDLKVRLIDARIPQPYMSSKKNIEKYQKLARRDGWKDIDLFVLSESSSPYDLTQNGYYETVYANINNDKSSLIVGFNRYDNFNEITDDYDIYNTMALVNKTGINYVYDKEHLVPFGEYIPLKKYLPFKKFTEGLKDFSRGQKRDTVTIAHIKLLPLICYEIIFSGLNIPQEIDAIVNISNDAWFGEFGKAQHLEIAKFRAVEEGLPVIRVPNYSAGNIGGSVISVIGNSIDGKIVDGKDGFNGIVKDFIIPVRIERTLFSKTGNIPFIIFCIFGFIAIINFKKLFDFTKKK